MTTFEEQKTRYQEFIELRDWDQFHTPRNAAAALSVEAGELLELFLWHDNLDAERVKEDSQLMEEIRGELADILIYCLSLSMQLDIDLSQAVSEKLDENETRFDLETADEITKELQRWQRDEP